MASMQDEMGGVAAGYATTGSPLHNGLHEDETVRRLAESTHASIDRIAAALESRTDALLTAKDAWLDSARETVREHPLAAVGVAALAGILIARLLRD
jgi:ElaB/YqjD/DUF883 family membrane-anchored ribosome-binding protein